MNVTAFASLLRRAFALDTWYTPDGATRALRRIGCKQEAGAVIDAARRGGWVEDHPTCPGDFCLLSAKVPTTPLSEQ